MKLDTSAGDMTAKFVVLADNDPGLCSRVLELFAKRNLVPLAIQGRRAEDAIELDVVQDGLDLRLAELIAEGMRACILVRSVDLVMPVGANL